MLKVVTLGLFGRARRRNREECQEEKLMITDSQTVCMHSHEDVYCGTSFGVVYDMESKNSSKPEGI